MSKRFFLGFAATLSAVFISCQSQDNPQSADSISARVTGTTLTSVEVNVVASPETSYFIKAYSAASFDAVSVDAIISQIRRKVENGSDSWTSYMKFGSDTFVFDNLKYGTDYKVIVFGLRGDGSVTSDPVVLDARTVSFEAELTVSELSHFGFSLNVKPNEPDYYWYPVVVEYDALYSNYTEVKAYLLSKIASIDIEAEAFQGEDTIYNVCNPGDQVVFALAAINHDREIISDIFSVKVNIPYDGFPVLSEDSSAHIHLCLYNSEKVALGTMIEMTNPSYDTFVFPMVDINDSAETLYGIAVRTASETEVCDFFAAYAQAYYDEVVNDPANQAYFGPLTPYQSFSLLYNTSASFPRTWDPVTAEQLESHLGGQPLRNAVYAACLLQIDSNGKVSVVEDSFARASYEF